MQAIIDMRNLEFRASGSRIRDGCSPEAVFATAASLTLLALAMLSFRESR